MNQTKQNDIMLQNYFTVSIFTVAQLQIETDDEDLQPISAHFKPIFGGFRELCY